MAPLIRIQCSFNLRNFTTGNGNLQNKTTMKQVLIVDDDDQIRDSLKFFFEDSDFKTYTAANPREGRLLYEMHQDCVVITDMFMPDRGGFGLIKDLKEQFPNAKIIAMSGGVNIGIGGFRQGKRKSLDLAKNYGVNYVFAKPLDMDELLASVLTLCQ
jgi:two-component system, chemotaxis family, chemotaxis protein CheY